jgi:hypothetical protein
MRGRREICTTRTEGITDQREDETQQERDSYDCHTFMQGAYQQ